MVKVKDREKKCHVEKLGKFMAQMNENKGGNMGADDKGDLG